MPLFTGVDHCVTQTSHVTIIILCRNNPIGLERSLTSALTQQPLCDVLLMDGSDDDRCQQVWKRNSTFKNLKYQRAEPKGCYEAMNTALRSIGTPWLHFLHSGDVLAGNSCIALLVDHAHWLSSIIRKTPAAVFGQAVIEDASESRLIWLSPDPRMRSVSRWLRHMVPCHQAMLFSTAWAQRHPYDPCNHICADRPVMRQALQQAGPQAYVRQPICHFRLDGISSQLPTWVELRQRWREPGRTPMEHLGELGKYLMRPIGSHYTLIMRLRSRLMGLLCR